MQTNKHANNWNQQTIGTQNQLENVIHKAYVVAVLGRGLGRGKGVVRGGFRV